VEDLIRGQVEVDTADLGDFVIAKTLEEPLYHLAVVVDDGEMGVTHVIRGEEHLSNTPRQILILEALGFERPTYAHIPLILAPDRSKLSKRAGAVSALEYRDQGYLPEAILNYLALLGWNPGTDEEIFSLEELIAKFDISKIQKGGAIFDTTKLKWVNKEWMQRNKEIVSGEIENRIKNKYGVSEVHPELVETVFERVETLGEVDEMLGEGELDYFFSAPTLDREKIAWKKSTPEDAKRHLEAILSKLSLPDSIMKYAEEVGKGDVLWPLRYALSGQEKSPDPFALLRILGTEESSRRVEQAIEIL
jgi:glutamyl-tRNA synthetase